MKLNNYFNTNNQFKMMMPKTFAQEIAELKAKVAKLEMYNQELEMQNKMYKKSTQGKLNDKLLSKIKQLEEQNNILIDKNKKQDLSIMQLQHNVNRVEKENIKLKKENERVYSLLDKKEKQITDLTDEVNIHKEEVDLLKMKNKEMTENNDVLSATLDCFKQFIRQHNLNDEFKYFVKNDYSSSIEDGIEQTSNEEQSLSLNLPQDSFWNKSENKRAGRLNNRNNNNPNYNELIRNNINFLYPQGRENLQKPLRKFYKKNNNLFYKKNNNLLKARAINNTELSSSIRNIDRFISFAQDH